MAKQRSREEKLERQNAQKAIQDVLARNTGKPLIKYLFKLFGVGSIPMAGLPTDLLNVEIGRLQMAEELFDFVAEADYNSAGLILAEIKKEKDDEYVVQEVHEM